MSHQHALPIHSGPDADSFTRAQNAALSRFVHLNQDKNTLPHYLSGFIDNEGRRVEMKTDPASIDLPGEEIRDLMEEGMDNATNRRLMELALADYISGIEPVADFQKAERDTLVEKMRMCRLQGVAGLKPDGGKITMWDFKCNLGKLCPDEAHSERKRVSSHYAGDIVRWSKRRERRRLQKWVLSPPNVEPGQLKEEKQAAIERMKDFLLGDVQACPVQWRKRSDRVLWDDGSCRYATIRSRKSRMKRFPSIKGMLMSQEDPLSKHHNWNVHLNLLLLIDGRLDWKEVRSEWGADAKFQTISKTDDDVVAQIGEMIKYAAEIVGVKSEEKYASGATEAPPMTVWPHELWIEWWTANKGFRRTRSYGVLYVLEKTHWNDASKGVRMEWMKRAEWPLEWSERGWKDFEKEQIKVLKTIIQAKPEFNLEDLQVVGSVRFGKSGYVFNMSVALEQGNNFSGSHQRKGKTYQAGAGWERFETGPPGYN